MCAFTLAVIGLLYDKAYLCILLLAIDIALTYLQYEPKSSFVSDIFVLKYHRFQSRDSLSDSKVFKRETVSSVLGEKFLVKIRNGL